MRRQIGWLVLGLCFYLGGGMVFLVTIFSVWGPEGVIEEGLTTVAVAMLVLSVLLFVTGGYFMRRGGASGVVNAYGSVYQFGGVGREPDDQSWSERQRGLYGAFDKSTLEGEANGERTVEQPAEEPGVSCPHCGAHNETGYRFCGNCSQKLS